MSLARSLALSVSLLLAPSTVLPALLSGCGGEVSAPPTLATRDERGIFADMPYARSDPRAQLPADLVAIGAAPSPRARRTLSAPAPGPAPEADKPEPGLPALGEVVALSQRPRDGRHEIYATEAGISDGARGRMDGSETAGFLDEVLPPPGGQAGEAAPGEQSSPLLIGFDDRTRVPPFSPGWGMTVKLFIQYGPGQSKTCTGTIVRKGYILTAGHCVFDRENGFGWSSRMVAVPALDGSYMPYGAYESLNSYSSAGWVYSGNYAEDWGLLEVGVHFDTGLGAASLFAATDTQLDGMNWQTHAVSAG